MKALEGEENSRKVYPPDLKYTVLYMKYCFFDSKLYCL